MKSECLICGTKLDKHKFKRYSYTEIEYFCSKECARYRALAFELERIAIELKEGAD